MNAHHARPLCASGPRARLVRATLVTAAAALAMTQVAAAQSASDPTVYDDAPRRNRLLSDYQGAADKLEELTGRWEAAMAELEAAKAALGDAG
mgnify:CR=1 FL=1